MANGLEALPMPLFGRQRFATVRDRLLTNPRFLSWAGAFPLTRFIARRRAAALFDLCAGFVYSQVLFSCVKLGVFGMVRDGPLPESILAKRLGLSEDAAGRLFTAARALRLLEARGESGIGLGPLGAAVAGDSGIAAMIEHHTHLYADLADPVALLRGEKGGTALSAYWPYAGAASPSDLGDEQVAAYSELMSRSLPLVAEEVLDVYPVGRHRRLLDVGGGEGVFAVAAAARAPNLELCVFDLPAVAARAKAHLQKAGLGKAEVVAGDFLSDALPKGADLVSLIRVILDHDDETALRILKAAKAALAPGGTLLLAEPLADTPGAETMGGAYFGFYLMAMGGGRPRSFAAIQTLLTQSGFTRIRCKTGRRVLRTGVVTAS